MRFVWLFLLVTVVSCSRPQPQKIKAKPLKAGVTSAESNLIFPFFLYADCLKARGVTKSNLMSGAWRMHMNSETEIRDHKLRVKKFTLEPIGPVPQEEHRECLKEAQAVASEQWIQHVGPFEAGIYKAEGQVFPCRRAYSFTRKVKVNCKELNNPWSELGKSFLQGR